MECFRREPVEYVSSSTCRSWGSLWFTPQATCYCGGAYLVRHQWKHRMERKNKRHFSDSTSSEYIVAWALHEHYRFSASCAEGQTDKTSWHPWQMWDYYPIKPTSFIWCVYQVGKERAKYRKNANHSLYHVLYIVPSCSMYGWVCLIARSVWAAAKTEGRRRIISKSFHHQLRYHEKQPLVGPPESMREHVIAATHAMRRGDWKKCRNYILEIKVQYIPSSLCIE